jgi:hypothetical protein
LSAAEAYPRDDEEPDSAAKPLATITVSDTDSYDNPVYGSVTVTLGRRYSAAVTRMTRADAATLYERLGEYLGLGDTQNEPKET